MNRIYKHAATLAIAALVGWPLHGFAQSIIPQPTEITHSSGAFQLDNSTAVYTNLKGKEAKNLVEYIMSTAPVSLKKGSTKAEKNIIKLVCTNTKAKGDALDDVALQGYELLIDGGKIVATAPSATGLFYAWQSILQLTDEHKQVKNCHISDSPRFAYRGVMIDCSRHFWTIDHLKKQIDILARLKMSRLHLHLTDGGGWRMEIKKYPELTEKGAYRTASEWDKWWDGQNRGYCTKDDEGAYGGYYTQKELKSLVDYAAKRHIIIIPEIEMPGHSDEVNYALPWLSCKNEPYSSGDMCVGKESTFTFIEDVLKEVMAIFPSKYIHIGGDEAGRKEWETCPACQQRMHDHNLKTTAELQSYLTRRVEKFLNQNGRQLLGWDEIIEGELAPNASVMSWRGEEAGIKSAELGHNVVMTPGAYCYIDAYQDAPPYQPAGFGSYLPLDKVYSYEPVPAHIKGTATEKHFHGVQVNLWTELVNTPEHLEYMLYPRTIAIAEVGWSKNKTSFDNFRHRTLRVLEQMQKEGYHPFDLKNEVGHRPGTASPIAHEGVGKPVKYVTKYVGKYNGKGDGGLTNGRTGDWNFNDGEWQGFIGEGRFEAVVDMEQPTDIRDIAIEFIQFRGPEIFYPSEVSFEISDDGECFTPVFCEKYPFDTEGYFIRPCQWNGSAHGRYVRVVAKASEKGGWIFTNEIFINKR